MHTTSRTAVSISLAVNKCRFPDLSPNKEQGGGFRLISPYLSTGVLIQIAATRTYATPYPTANCLMIASYSALAA